MPQDARQQVVAVEDDVRDLVDDRVHIVAALDVQHRVHAVPVGLHDLQVLCVQGYHEFQRPRHFGARGCGESCAKLARPLRMRARANGCQCEWTSHTQSAER